MMERQQRPLVVHQCTPSNQLILAGKTDHNLHMLRRDLALERPCLREMVQEASGTFMVLQKQDKIKDKADNDWLRHISWQYRSILRGFMESAEDEGDQEMAIAATQMEFVWNFCEILFLTCGPGDVVTADLLSWIQVHFTSCQENAKQVVADGTADAHPLYWQALIGYVVQGRITEARNFLEIHSAAELDAFQVMGLLLRTMPIYDPSSNQPAHDHVLRWQKWRREVLRHQDEGTFSQENHLDLLCQVLAGDEKGIAEARDLLSLSWYEVLAAWIFFTQPCTYPGELRTQADSVLDMCRDAKESSLGQCDWVLMAAMDGDAHMVVLEAHRAFRNTWMTAHLGDLLYHTGRSGDVTHKLKLQNLTPATREGWVIDLAEALMSHSQLWQLGLAYLDYCPIKGQALQSEFLDRIPTSGGEYAARKIISESVKRNLTEEARSVCIKQAREMLARGEAGHGMSWALRCSDPILTTSAADNALNNLLATGTFLFPDILEHLGINMLLSDHLIFLTKYYEFNQLYSSNKYKEALQLLLAIVKYAMTPKTFWPSLMCDATPLMENSDLVMNQSQLNDLCLCIERASYQAAETNSDPQFSEKEKLARKAFAFAHANSIARLTGIKHRRQ